MSVKRRDLLKSAPVGLLALGVPALPRAAQVEQAAPVAPQAYTFLRPSEAAFIERLSEHMVPADDLSPSGFQLGIALYIDRALSSGWGKGERLYQQGPFAEGTPAQGYQLGLPPARLFRVATAGLFVHVRQTTQRAWSELDEAGFETLLQQLAGNQQVLDGVPSGVYFEMLYGLVREGLFADPAYGGNRDKGGWRLLGFPGVIQSNRRNIVRFHDRPYRAEPLAIADVSGWSGER
ncbi:gluconate 2-dehydrogenase subunit 3 family protein [Pseudomonas sp. ABC1]|uniref:gluconate 2-dehydrogenase subunit 3 family protein n=1 Tax=Pseudomonas sp. ABC1 TaxID=2748080 RepID=UPI0015C3D259|nr:gluconate 2-dehydrogenase subunit 3 family protein [Pseudomonas sp. ABC1]QLF93973.1 gluconate 2-dehydrogenase subunit 3 family protein [Pseudomonas sp. ABC1]